jgi:hypothetical protein
MSENLDEILAFLGFDDLEQSSIATIDPFPHKFLKYGRPERGSESEDALVEQVFQHYRDLGFPYLDEELVDVGAEFQRLRSTPSCLDGDTVKQSMVGLSLANVYHDHVMVNVRCRAFRTPFEVFNDDDLLRQAVRNRIRHGDNLKNWGIRKAIFSLSRTQRASNFRPSAAKSIYEHFKPSRVLDFSAGWGGRMLGAMAANIPYIGIDPSTNAIRNNLRLVSKLSGITQSPVELIQACAEDVLGKRQWGRFPLIFTSPPYFNVEQYSDEPTQSYLRYPTMASWQENFLKRCLEGCYEDLEDDGHLVLNVNPDMARITIDLAKSSGFQLKFNWKLVLSQHQFNKKSNGLYRYEPILVFQKC